MRKRWQWVALSSLIASALVGPVTARTKDTFESREVQSLARELAERTPGKSAQCIDLQRMNGPESFGDRTIVYRQSHRRIWVSTLRDRCPWLRGDRTLIVESFGSQVCRSDLFRVLPRGSTIASGACFFGAFTPYDRVAKR